MKKPHIVILGAGYGGIMTTVKLQKSLNVQDASITLVNNHDYHYQTTWLHENAAGTIHDEKTRIPIRDLITKKKVSFIPDTVVSIHPEQKKIKLKENDCLYYDLLVIGLGIEPAVSDIPGAEDYSLTVHDINSARYLREHLEYNFASYQNEKEKDSGRLNIVLAGSGYNGIELAGELANRIPELCKAYDIEKSLVRIINLEGSSNVFSQFDPQLAEYAVNSLVSRGIEFITGATLKECREDRIVYEKDHKTEHLLTRTIICTDGVRASSVLEDVSTINDSGKVEVRKDMRTIEHDDIFVLGSSAQVVKNENHCPYPPTVQTTIQQSAVVAHNIKALLHHEEMIHFYPSFLGTAASLGHNDGILEGTNGRKLFGWKAAFMKVMNENRYLLELGGPSLLMKKGKFNFF
jgi:NADH dehydrogenase